MLMYLQQGCGSQAIIMSMADGKLKTNSIFNSANDLITVQFGACELTSYLSTSNSEQSQRMYFTAVFRVSLV